MSDEIKIAVINLSTGLVENIAVISDGDGSRPVEGFHFVPSDDAAIGDTWDGQQIVKAPEPEPVLSDGAQVGQIEPGTPGDSVAALRKDYDALGVRLAALERKG